MSYFKVITAMLGMWVVLGFWEPNVVYKAGRFIIPILFFIFLFMYLGDISTAEGLRVFRGVGHIFVWYTIICTVLLGLSILFSKMSEAMPKYEPPTNRQYRYNLQHKPGEPVYEEPIVNKGGYNY